MDRSGGGRPDSSRQQRAALRALLIGATASAGRRGDKAHLERLVEVAPIDALPAAAALHRVAGSVLCGLHGVEGIPSGVRARLAGLQQQAALRHLLLTGALGRIGGAFDDADISWVVMKGPVVAALLYPHVGDRSYADLDLLVERQHFPHAVELLEQLGFHHHIHNWALAEDQLAGEIQMSDGSVVVDLHWHLHYSPEDRRPFAIVSEEMLQRRRRVVVSGVPAPTLDAVDTVLALAFHAARSDGHRLVWLKDIERAVAVEQPDLDELVRRCRQYHCAPPVGLLLGRAHAVLGADIPESIIRTLTPALMRTAERLVTTLVHPVQLHERVTPTRAFTRSIKSSVGASVQAMPARGARRVLRMLLPPTQNETDDPAEKASYLLAVSASTD
jgi:hypothetical protein